jgi:hypothetical protein
MFSVGSIVGYTVLIGNQLRTTFQRLSLVIPSLPVALEDRTLIIVVVCTCIILPLALQKNLHGIRIQNYVFY